MFHNNKWIQRFAFVALLTSLLSACTSYQPKSGEAVSRIRFVTFVNDTSFIAIDDMTACPHSKRLIYKRIAGQASRWSSVIGMKGEAPRAATAAAELAIPAGQPLPFHVGSYVDPRQFQAGYRCSVGLSFVPEAGSEYEVHYTTAYQKCNVQIFRLEEKASGYVARLAVPGAKPLSAEFGQNLCVQPS